MTILSAVVGYSSTVDLQPTLVVEKMKYSSSTVAVVVAMVAKNLVDEKTRIKNQNFRFICEDEENKSNLGENVCNA